MSEHCAFDACPILVPHGDVKTMAAAAGIELRGDDGFPWHCDKQLDVGSGIFGPDIVECDCGVSLVLAASPHVNGGVIFPEEVPDTHLGETWIVLSKAAAS